MQNKLYTLLITDEYFKCQFITSALNTPKYSAINKTDQIRWNNNFKNNNFSSYFFLFSSCSSHHKTTNTGKNIENNFQKFEKVQYSPSEDLGTLEPSHSTSTHVLCSGRNLPYSSTLEIRYYIAPSLK